MASSRPPMGVVKAAASPAAVPISTQSRWPASECDGPAQPRGSRIPNAFVMDLRADMLWHPTGICDRPAFTGNTSMVTMGCP